MNSGYYRIFVNEFPKRACLGGAFAKEYVIRPEWPMPRECREVESHDVRSANFDLARVKEGIRNI